MFREGLEAIRWTVEDRGLAGLSDLEGLSWRLDMESFFEAWCESVAEETARAFGMRLRSGRKEETGVALDWRPRHSGTQRSLLPDIVLEREDLTLIIDAKYKVHAEELAVGWRGAADTVREAHRQDLLQVLAYSTLSAAPRTVACLMYPCTPETFRSLVARGMVLSRTRVPSAGGAAGAGRTVELALLATPLGLPAGEVLEALAALIRRPEE